MSKAKLKKYLQTLSKEQVIEVMLELYDARKEAKDYLSSIWLLTVMPNWKNARKLSDKSSSLLVAFQKSPHSPSAGKSFPISRN